MEVLFGGSFFLGVLALIVAIAWVILPFALIGTKTLLRELIAEQRRTNALLEALARRNVATAVSDVPSAPPIQPAPDAALATPPVSKIPTDPAVQRRAILITVVVVGGAVVAWLLLKHFAPGVAWL